MKRAILIRDLAESTIRGRLGLFVGAGFSMAATNNQALSFEKLLIKVSDNLELELDFGNSIFTKKSLPQVASVLMEKFVERHASSADARSDFKREIADLCALLPTKALRPVFSEILQRIQPSWVITTNYDQILEALLDQSETILASEPLFPSTTRVPIYHLHGYRLKPDTICITEEDYVGLLAKLDYQRLRLPLLLYESTTLVLGYKAEDINVRAAIAWANSFKQPKTTRIPLPGHLVQGLHVAGRPRVDPYVGKDGQLILELNEIKDLLLEIADEKDRLKEREELDKRRLEQFIDTAEIGILANFKNLPQFKELFDISISRGQSSIVAFLTQIFDALQKRVGQGAPGVGAERYLLVMIEVLRYFGTEVPGPLVIELFAGRLDRIWGYMTLGKKVADPAWQVWKREFPKLSEGLQKELILHARTGEFAYLGEMLSAPSTPHIDPFDYD
ncbi:MAG: SIR2 family protein [Opitutaceae bacterium]